MPNYIRVHKKHVNKIKIVIYGICCYFMSNFSTFVNNCFSIIENNKTNFNAKTILAIKFLNIT